MLGWKYVDAAEEAQKYKVGKFILETKRVVKSNAWEDVDEVDDEREGGGSGKRGRSSEDAAEIEFDSQDEDECEDLFSGIWSQKLARSRRRNRGLAV